MERAYPMISVLVVDDSTFMRNTITSLLEQDSEIKVVGTARNGQEALEKAEVRRGRRGVPEPVAGCR